MKITVLGAGNAGCLTALHYGFFGRIHKKVEVELIHNPDKKPEKVGQGTLLDLPKLLWESMGFNMMENRLDATPKHGILYENWGKKNELVPHPFPPTKTALHISPAQLQDSILKSGYFKVIEKDIDSYDEIDSDFIFDCRGKPSQKELESDAYDILTGHVNSVILANAPGADLRQHWTKAIATPDGWCFAIPLGDYTTSYGYLYDHTVTSEEKARSNFQQMFGVQLPISFGPSSDVFKFDQYVAKEPIIDNRIILNGNRLFFFEPLEATAMSTYSSWNQMTWAWIVDKFETPKTLKRTIKIYAHKISNFVSWHYTYGSKYDTPFWQKAKKESVLKYVNTSDQQLRHIIKMATENSHREIRKKLQDGIFYDWIYAQWDVLSFHYWIEGMTKKINHPNRYPFE